MSIFKKSVEKNASFINIGQEYKLLYMKTCTFFITSRSILLKMCIFLEKIRRENKKKQLLLSFFFSKIVLFMGQCRKKFVQPARLQVTTWCMRIAWWIPKATNTHSQYVILVALPLQIYLQESASILRFTYIACIFIQSRLMLTLKSGNIQRFIKMNIIFTRVIQ